MCPGNREAWEELGSAWAQMEKDEGRLPFQSFERRKKVELRLLEVGPIPITERGPVPMAHAALRSEIPGLLVPPLLGVVCLVVCEKVKSPTARGHGQGGEGGERGGQGGHRGWQRPDGGVGIAEAQLHSHLATSGTQRTLRTRRLPGNCSLSSLFILTRFRSGKPKGVDAIRARDGCTCSLRFCCRAVIWLVC